MYEYQANLIRVVDGDTYHLDIDLGLEVHAHVTVRLRGVNCPERFTPEGKRATTAARDWFFEHEGIAQTPVTIQTHKGDEHDKYGRWVADVTQGSDNLAVYLAANGYGLAI